MSGKDIGKDMLVSQYMTEQPHTIGYDRPIENAQKMMREHRIRHLPVLKAGELVGVLTDRDINLVLKFETPAATQMNVEEACTYSPFVTTADKPLSQVVSEMRERKIGSTVVVDKDKKVVGIFTDIDAMRALADLLQA